MAVLLGLAVALTYGAADFLGGLSSKRSPPTAVVVLSQLWGLPVLILLVLLTDGDAEGRSLALGAGAGAGGGVGLLCLYRGLAIGRMSIVAPITAVGAAVVPLVWGLLHGERPSRLALAGAVLAIFAVALISRTVAASGSGGNSTRIPTAIASRMGGREGVGLAVAAGAAFGWVFVLLGETSSSAGFWPLLAGRVTLIVLLAAGAAAAGRSLAPGPRSLPGIAGTGALDLTAGVLYLLASRRGLLALVAVLSALYPVSTVLLARVVLGERLGRHQVVGLGLALAGVVLIAGG